MHFGNDTRWWSGQERLNNIFVSYISRVNQQIALLVENQSEKNSYQVKADHLHGKLLFGSVNDVVPETIVVVKS